MSDLTYLTIPELQTLSQVLHHYYAELQKQREGVVMVKSRDGDSFKYNFEALLGKLEPEMTKIKDKMMEINAELDLRIKAALDIEMNIKPMSDLLIDFQEAYQEFKQLQNQDFKNNNSKA
jgi:hypothetical protein